MTRVANILARVGAMEVVGDIVYIVYTHASQNEQVSAIEGRRFNVYESSGIASHCFLGICCESFSVGCGPAYGPTVVHDIF